MDTEKITSVQNVFIAELQFRLACAVELAVTMGNQPLDLPIQWVHGNHKVEYKEVALRKDQADVASQFLKQSATYLMAVAMKDAIKAVEKDPYNHTNLNIRGAYQIARLIRNAFAHAPFNPVWSIDPKCRNKVFEVTDILKLDTTNLDGVPFDWRHYGGLLALLKLCHYVRFEILQDTSRKPSEREIDTPEIVYIQQGDLILKQLTPKESEQLGFKTKKSSEEK